MTPLLPPLVRRVRVRVRARRSLWDATLPTRGAWDLEHP